MDQFKYSLVYTRDTHASCAQFKGLLSPFWLYNYYQFHYCQLTKCTNNDIWANYDRIRVSKLNYTATSDQPCDDAAVLRGIISLITFSDRHS